MYYVGKCINRWNEFCYVLHGFHNISILYFILSMWILGAVIFIIIICDDTLEMVANFDMFVE